jgi:hypothetical protein
MLASEHLEGPLWEVLNFTARFLYSYMMNVLIFIGNPDIWKHKGSIRDHERNCSTTLLHNAVVGVLLGQPPTLK